MGGSSDSRGELEGLGDNEISAENESLELVVGGERGEEGRSGFGTLGGSVEGVSMEVDDMSSRGGEVEEVGGIESEKVGGVDSVVKTDPEDVTGCVVGVDESSCGVGVDEPSCGVGVDEYSCERDSVGVKETGCSVWLGKPDSDGVDETGSEGVGGSGLSCVGGSA